MRLHALYGMTEHAPTLDVDFALFCNDAALHVGSGPEVVVHGTPRGLHVCAVVGCAIRSALEAGCGPGEFDIHHAVFIHCRLDCVKRTIFGKLDGDAVGIERVLLLVEAVVAQGIGGP